MTELPDQPRGLGRRDPRATPLRHLALLVALVALWTPSVASASDLVIAEFLARNDSGLADEDGDRSDWIELQCRSPQPISTEGWYLTDRADALTLWRLPHRQLEPGERLLVFASGKDRTGDELHASFRLEVDGEYLALVMPDGLTVAQEFAPTFPPQRADVSFGFAAEVSELIQSGAHADVLVPEADPGTTWRSRSYVPDAAWLRDAPLPVGFDLAGQSLPEDLVSWWPLDGDLADVTGRNDGTWSGGIAPSFDAGISGDAVRLDGSDDLVVVTPRDGLPIFNRPEYTVALWVRGPPQPDKRVYSEGSSTNNSPVFNIGVDSTGSTGKVDIFIRTATGARLHSHTLSRGVAFDDTWHHIAWVDRDGDAALYIDGERDATDFSYSKQSLPLDRASIGAILRASESFHFGGSIDDVTIWDRALDVDEIAALAGGGNPLDLGGFGEQVATDLAALMHESSASAHVRVPFFVDDPTVLDSLSLRVRFDDGFVAFVNGLEVARRNAPANVDWQSAATGESSPSEAFEGTTLSLGAALPHLELGHNVLALHALNASSADEDFFLDVALEAASSLALAPSYFVEPTPGEPNRGGFEGLVADTRFSVDRGFHDTPFYLEISSDTPGAEIRYTLDGREPGEGAGIVYRDPIWIDTTSTVRAAAFRDGLLPTNVDTHTYIFRSAVLEQTAPQAYPSSWGGIAADYVMDPDVASDPARREELFDGLVALPSLSLVLDPEDVFGSGGLYQNPSQRGASTERAVSAEFIFPREERDVQVDAALRNFGNVSRNLSNTPKIGFRLLFKGAFGPRKFNYPLFPDSPVREFDTLAIRTNFKDSWLSPSSTARREAQYVRDEFVRRAHLATGKVSPHGIFVHLYLNGLYWGLYNVTERPDDSFSEEYFGGAKEEYDVIKNHEEVQSGSIDAYRELEAIVAAGVDSASDEAALRSYLDVENLIDYMIANMYAPAVDWPGNYYMTRLRQEGAGFRFFTWDSEEALTGSVTLNRTVPHWRDDDSPTKFFHPLKGYPPFQLEFGDRLHRHFFNDGPLSGGRMVELFGELTETIEPAMVCESARWGDYRRSTPYLPEGEWSSRRDYFLGQYLPVRSDIVVGQFTAQGLYPSVRAPTFEPHGGLFEPGESLRITSEVGETFYTLDGSDPRLPDGAVSDLAILLTADSEVLEVQDDIVVSARSLVGDRWSALNRASFIVDRGLRVSEVHYHPAEGVDGTTPPLEFVELVNVAATPVALSPYRLAGGVAFDFALGAIAELGGGDRAVVVQDALAFRRFYGDVPMVLGEFGGRLSNRGDTLRLEKAGGFVQELAYRDHWHPSTDGGAHSLVLLDPGAPPRVRDRAESWQASALPHGSPGEAEPSAGGLVRPGDANADGRLDVGDAVRLLVLLLRRGDTALPCDGDDIASGDNVALLDFQGDARVDLSDAVSLLRFLFTGGPPHALGQRCVPLVDCPDTCGAVR